ncbi:MAG: hypothetical protein NVV77_01020 [Devosia sp.]|nr:hypothetical protein [Devosia sp.]MCR6633456.1 hypothetical protein [Devosia sp.]
MGSSIANLLLILGASAMLTPIVVQSSALRRDAVLMVAVAIVFALLSPLFPLGRLVGLMFVAALGAYICIAIRQEERSNTRSMVRLLTRASQPRMAILHLFRRKSPGSSVLLPLATSLTGLAIVVLWGIPPFSSMALWTLSVGRHFRDRDWPHHSGSRHVDAQNW